MKLTNNNNVNGHGFTTLEVIAVLVVIGILSAIAIFKVASTATYSLAAESEVIKMHLRYAQFRALSDTQKWGISISGDAKSYTLIYGNVAPFTTPYLLPNDSSATHQLPGDIIFALPAAGTTINFDEWGSPGASDIQVKLSSGGGFQQFTLTKNTGFIP